MRDQRNHGSCPPSPAADTTKPRTNAGTSIAATCASARSPSGSAFQSRKIRGAGHAAFIQAVIRTISQWAGESQWRACRADLTRYRLQGYTGWGSEGFWALANYRLQKVVRRCRPRWLWAPVRLTPHVVKKLLSIVTLIDLHPDAEIGPGMIICHGGPIRIHAETNIGADCALHGACTIGAGPRPGGAVIGTSSSGVRRASLVQLLLVMTLQLPPTPWLSATSRQAALQSVSRRRSCP
jgi:hypothetical protein